MRSPGHKFEREKSSPLHFTTSQTPPPLGEFSRSMSSVNATYSRDPNAWLTFSYCMAGQVLLLVLYSPAHINTQRNACAPALDGETHRIDAGLLPGSANVLGHVHVHVSRVCAYTRACIAWPVQLRCSGVKGIGIREVEMLFPGPACLLVLPSAFLVSAIL